VTDIFDEWYGEIAAPVPDSAVALFDEWDQEMDAAAGGPVVFERWDAEIDQANQAEGRSVGDYTRALSIGFDKLGQLAGRGLDVVGMDETGQKVERFYKDREAQLRSEQSPSYRAEREKRFFVEDESGKTRMGAAWTSAPKMIGTVLESLPAMTLGSGTGMVLARGLIKLGLSSGLAGILGGAIGEGSMAGIESSKDIYDMVLAAPIEQISQTDEFAKAYSEAASNQSLTHDQLVKIARGEVAKRAAMIGGATVAGSTALLGAPSGAAMGRLVGGEVGKRLPTTMLKQAGLEMAQEAPQSGVEQMVSNVAGARYKDPKIDILQDVGEAMVEGGLAGFVMGGAMGHLAHNQGKINLLNQPAPGPETDVAGQINDLNIGDGRTVDLDTSSDLPFAFPEQTKDEQAAMEVDILRQRAAQNAPPDRTSALRLQNQDEINRLISQEQAAEQERIRQAQIDQGFGARTGDVPGMEVDQTRQDDEILNRLAGVPLPDRDQRLALPYPDSIDPNAIALPYDDAIFDAWDAEMVDSPMEAPAGAMTRIPNALRYGQQSSESITAEANQAATSPLNNLPEPTEAQKEAGNYQKGHVKIQGLDISIENPDGSTRSGTTPDGKKWKTTMNGHYGYFKRTEGKDGDQVDVFVGLKPRKAHPVFVIDQVDPETGQFDEHKVIMGVGTEQEARELYLSNYEPGWRGLGAITQMHVLPFKKWLASGKTKKPVREIRKAVPDIDIESAKPQATKKPHELPLSEFESAHAPHEITRQQWTDMQRVERRRLGQSEESGTKQAPYADYEQYHRQAVKEAVENGKPVPGSVLADYPDLANQSQAKRQSSQITIPEKEKQRLEDLNFEGKRTAFERDEQQALVLTGGPPGAGKSTSIKALGLKTDVMVRADADLIKEQAGYEDRADAFHETSSEINKRVANRAIDQGYHLLYDSLLTNFALADELIQRALENTGRVSIAFTHIDAETSIVRAKARVKSGQSKRKIPPAASIKGYNRALPTFIALYKKYKDNPNVNFALSDNNVDGRKQVLVFTKTGKDEKVLNQTLFDNLMQTDYVEIGSGEETRYERRKDRINPKSGEDLADSENVRRRISEVFENQGTQSDRKTQSATEHRGDNKSDDGKLGGSRTAIPASPDRPTPQKPRKEVTPQAPSSTYGTTNKIFTQNAAAKAREILRKKLNQLNAGIDPEILQAGITLAGYHIEAGAKSFVAYSRAMLSDLGEAVRPYLRSFYEGVRYYPGMASAGMTAVEDIKEVPAQPTPQPEKVELPEVPSAPLETEGKSPGLTFDQVAKLYNDAFKNMMKYRTDQAGAEYYAEELGRLEDEYPEWVEQIENQKQSNAPPALAKSPETPSMKIANWIQDALRTKSKIVWTKLFDKAKEVFGGTQAEGKYTPRDAYDAMELGVNRYVLDLDIVKRPADAAQAAYVSRFLKKRVDLLPTQSKRTKEQQEFQQFSTPPPLAYAANWVANIRAGDIALEPSAGTGGLAAFAKAMGANKVIGNELSPRRAELLEQLGIDQVFRENAEQLHNVLPEDVKPTVIVMNPPFSATAGRMSKNKTAYGAQHIEQALARLEPGGRLVAIVGKGMAEGSPTFRQWWDGIKKKYTVRANVGINGEEYAKYGTTFDNQLLVIDKTGATQENVTIGKVNTIEELFPILEGVKNERTAQSQQALRQPTGEKSAVESQGRSEPKPAVSSAIGTMGAGSRQDGAIRRPVDRPGRDNEPLMDPGQGDESLDDRGGDRGKYRVGASGKRGGSQSSGSRRGTTRKPSRLLGEGSPDVLQRGELDEDRTTAVQVEETTRQKSTAKLSESIYEQYVPSRLSVPGTKPHPTPMVESAAMAAVDMPTPNYAPQLDKDVVPQGKLSLAQIEQVVYAGQAHSDRLPNGERRGYFVGDGTGVGKGRIISGIIMDNWNQGRKKAVWLSKTFDLIQDAKRDADGIGFPANRIIPLNAYKIDQPVTLKEGVIFCTYSTLAAKQRPQSAEQDTPVEVKRLDQLVEWLGPDFDGALVFDESHKMGNLLERKEGFNVKKPAQSAMAGDDLQRALPNARITYVSATGATEPHNLAYASRLGLWGDGTPFASNDLFVSSLENSGVAAMELVARDLKSMGLYLARSLSFDGVEYEQLTHTLTEPQRTIYDSLAESWQVVLQNMNEAIGLTGVGKKERGSIISQFWGAHQRFFNQVTTAMSMPSVIKSIRRDLDAGHSAVVQLVNTNEAAQERALTRAKIAGDDIAELDFTPRETLIEYVQNGFPVQQFEEYTDENGNLRTRPVVDSAGNPVVNREAVEAREALIRRLSMLQVPHNPIDMILEEFGEGMVAEVTGRKRRVLNGKEQKRGAASKVTESKAFMDGKKRVLVFSQAGGTGASYHADIAAKNQQKRIHYLLQAGWRADEATQGFGRTHRSNQAQPPKYIPVSTDLKGQKRFVSSIARRLDQLGALTKGQRQTGSQGIFKATDNLENDHANAAWSWFVDDLFARQIDGIDFEDFMSQTALPLLKEDEMGQLRLNVPPLKQFLNRLLSLKVDMQNKVFGEFEQRYADVLLKAEQKGTLDKGMANLEAESARILDETLLRTDERTGAQTKLIKLQTTHKRPLMQWDVFREEYPAPRHGFWTNNQSGAVFAAFPGGTKDMPDGSIETMVNLKTINQAYVKKIPRKELEERYGKISEIEAENLWTKQYDDAEKIRTAEQYMLSGLLLPIWNEIQGFSRGVYRAQTDDGVRIVGPLVAPDFVGTLVERFGVEAERPKMTGETAFDTVYENGKTLELENGWKVGRRQVSGETRIEVEIKAEGDLSTAVDQLEKLGAFSETINWKTRVFVPTGTTGEKVMQDIIARYPVVRVTGGKSESDSADRQAPAKRPAYTGGATVDTTQADGHNYYVNIQGKGFVKAPANAAKADLSPLGVDAFIHRDEDGEWVVTEATTGLKVVAAEDEHGAIKAARNKIRDFGKDKFDQLVNDQIEKNGASPWAQAKKILGNEGGFVDLSVLFTKAPDNFEFDERSDLGKRTRMTQPPAWIAKKHPEFKALFDRQQARKKQRMRQLAEALDATADFWKMDGAEMDQLRRLVWSLEGQRIKDLKTNKLTKDDEGKYLINDAHYTEYRQWLDKIAGVSDHAKAVYIDIRKSLDQDLATVINTMQSMDDIDEGVIDNFRKAVGNIHNYFPHMRYGNHYIQVKDAGGNVVYREHFNAVGPAKLKAISRAKELAKQFPDHEIRSGPVEKLPEDVYAIPIPVEALEAVMDAAVRRLGTVDTEAKEAFRQLLPKALSDTLKSRGWGSHLINRKGIPGHEIEDIRRVLFDYKSGLYGWLTKMSASRDFSETMAGVAKSASRQPNLWAAMRQYVYDMMANSDQWDRATNTLRAVFFAKYLGGNVKTAALNLTQNIIAGWPRLGMETGRAMGQTINAAASDLVATATKQKNLKPEERKLLEEMFEEGTTSSNFLHEVRGQINSNVFSAGNKIMRVLGWPMAVAESFNRSSLAIAAFRVARGGKINNKKTLAKYGLEPGEKAPYGLAKAFAEEIVDDSHFVYGKENRPEIFRGGAGNKVLALGYTFRTFTHNLINLWTYMLKNGGRGVRAAIKSIGATIAIGGISSIPLYKTLLNAIKQLTGDDPEDEALEALGVVDNDLLRDIIVYGLPAGLGVNLGGSVGMELPVFDNLKIGDSITGQIGRGFGEIVGVPWAVIEDAENALRSFNSGQHSRALEYLVPTSMANPIKAYRLYTEGQSTISGQPINMPGRLGAAKLTQKEAIGKAFGFQPVSSTKAWDLQQDLEDFRAYKLNEQHRLANKLANALRDQDKNARDTVLADWKNWNKKQFATGRPEYIITPDNMVASMRARTKNQLPPTYLRKRAAEMMDQRGMFDQ
jgi:predicted ABC-type ATPase